jgi:hypothetical protein
MRNKHQINMFGLEYAINPFKKRSTTEGLTLAGRTLKLKFRKPAAEEINDPLVLDLNPPFFNDLYGAT